MFLPGSPRTPDVTSGLSALTCLPAWRSPPCLSHEGKPPMMQWPPPRARVFLSSWGMRGRPRVWNRGNKVIEGGMTDRSPHAGQAGRGGRVGVAGPVLAGPGRGAAAAGGAGRSAAGLPPPWAPEGRAAPCTPGPPLRAAPRPGRPRPSVPPPPGRAAHLMLLDHLAEARVPLRDPAVELGDAHRGCQRRLPSGTNRNRMPRRGLRRRLRPSRRR